MSNRRSIFAIFACALSLLAAHQGAGAATTIDISSTVLRTNVQRFGIGMAQQNYYDSAQMMKELLFRNPGFEGLLFQSVVRLGSNGSATNAIEDQPLGTWPSGFWNGGNYQVIWSGAAPTAKDRQGVISQYLAPYRPSIPDNPTGIPPSDPNGSTSGATYVFADTGTVVAAGDYLRLSKTFLGGTGGGAAYGSWDIAVTNGGAVTTEQADLPPHVPDGLPAGQQCARLTALAASQQASIRGVFDTLQGFIRMDGQFRLAFKAKGLGGANQALVTVRRGNLAPYLSQTVQLATGWTNQVLTFNVSEPTNISGSVAVSFAVAGQGEFLLDDVSLRQSDSSTNNPTEYRDAVVDALRGLRPGILRHANWQDVGNSLENELAPVFARKRSGYSVYSSNENNMMPGLHEFLVLCEHIGANPWYCLPVTFTTQEAAGLMEYLGGATNTPYGALRAARGHPIPWTNVFSRFHLEFGNENWNNTAFRGAAISAAVPCGERASEIFATLKGSPYYNPAQVQCILGGQTAVPTLNQQIHNASSQHDAFCLAPYMSSRVDSFETAGQVDPEKLFGSLLAEPEWWSYNPSITSGFMRVNRTNLLNSSRPVPLAIYEVNLHTTEGSISQAALDAFTPSVGAALAVSAHMLTMLRELDARDQCFFSLPGHRTARTDGKTAALWGAVLDMGKTDRKRPHYHAMQLLNEALAGDLLQTTHSGDNPTWSVTNQNRVSYNGAHYVQSFAFDAGAVRSLMLFNFHRTDTLDVNFTGTHAPTGTVTMKRLTAANITDNNETNESVFSTLSTVLDLQPAAPFSLPPFSMTLLQWHTDLSLNLTRPTPPLALDWQAIPRRPYTLEYSTNLAEGFTASTNTVSTPDERLYLTGGDAITTADGPIFFRLRQP